MAGSPQTPLDKFFSPFDAVEVVDDESVSSDAVFAGQNWQNLCFAFVGATQPNTLTLPGSPIVGMRVTVIDADRSVTGVNTMSLVGNGAAISTPAGEGPTAVAVSTPGGSMTVLFASLAQGWVVLAGVGASAEGGGGGSPIGAGFYGDGSDGTATCDGVATVAGMTLAGGNYTLVRDVYFASLTINASVALNCGGFRLFVSGTLTVAGRLHADGGAGALGGLNGGGPNAQNTRLGGGGQGTPGNGSSTVNAFGGNGGACSFGTTGGAAIPFATPAYGSIHGLDAISGYLTSGAPNVNANPDVFYGGGGGGGAGSACGGGGGGVLVVVALTLVGAGSVSANGGAGMFATYYSGGGGGGVVILVTRSRTAFSGTVTANGGASGGGSATAGANGTVVNLSN